MNENTNPDVMNEALEASDDEEMIDITSDYQKEETQPEEETPAEAPKKKRRILQAPVIVSICIVLVTVLAYFGYIAFFLREPDGMTWSIDYDDMTYYYEFTNDGLIRLNYGSIELETGYLKNKGDDGNSISVLTSIGDFYSSREYMIQSPNYTITGSRILNNQEMTVSYGQTGEFTLKQDKKQDFTMDVPEEFTPDKELIGTWVCHYTENTVYKVTFTEDGHMAWITENQMEAPEYKYAYAKSTINGVYTVDGSVVNFTFTTQENTVEPIDYSVNGDYLNFLVYQFVREGSDAVEGAATSDQQTAAAAE